MTNKISNYIIIRYSDLNNETQLAIDRMLRERAEEQVEEDIQEGYIHKDDAEDAVIMLIEKWTAKIWTELEV